MIGCGSKVQIHSTKIPMYRGTSQYPKVKGELIILADTFCLWSPKDVPPLVKEPE
jgi:hypothetical protein